MEHTLLAIMAAAEDIPLEKAYMLFSGLDIRPRLGMAINLARYHKWPSRLLKRLGAIRIEIQGNNGRNGLAEKRNLVVHGVQKTSTRAHSITFTVPRNHGTKLHTDVSVKEMYDLAASLNALAKEAGSIFDDYGTWKFGSNSEKNGDEQLA